MEYTELELAYYRQWLNTTPRGQEFAKANIVMHPADTTEKWAAVCLTCYSVYAATYSDDAILERNTTAKGRTPKYNWDEWFDGRTRRLRKSVHFPECRDAETFRRGQVYTAARQRGLRVRTAVDGFDLIIRAEVPKVDRAMHEPMPGAEEYYEAAMVGVKDLRPDQIEREAENCVCGHDQFDDHHAGGCEKCGCKIPFGGGE